MLFRSVAGRFAEADALFRRSIDIRERTYGKTHHNLATALDNLGVPFLRQGKQAGAQELFRRAISIRENYLGPNHELVAVSEIHLAQAMRDSGRKTEARRHFRRAAAILGKLPGSPNPELARVEEQIKNL